MVKKNKNKRKRKDEEMQHRFRVIGVMLMIGGILLFGLGGITWFYNPESSPHTVPIFHAGRDMAGLGLLILAYPNSPLWRD